MFPEFPWFTETGDLRLDLASQHRDPLDAACKVQFSSSMRLQTCSHHRDLCPTLWRPRRPRQKLFGETMKPSLIKALFIHMISWSLLCLQFALIETCCWIKVNLYIQEKRTKLSDDLKSESHCKAPFCKRSVALKMIASSANTYQNPLLRDMNHELLLVS